MTQTIDSNGFTDLRQSTRAGTIAASLSALCIGIGYLVIMAAYFQAGVELPDTGKGWIDYMNGKSGIWNLIIWLSVVTDILYLPVGYKLYEMLRQKAQWLATFSLVFFCIFVFIDLAVTQPTFHAVLRLSERYNATVDEGARQLIAAAAEYGSTVISKAKILEFYVILIPGLGVMGFSVAMLKNGFGRVVAYVGILSGAFAIISVVGGSMSALLHKAYIPASLLSLIWFFGIGVRLFGIARAR